MKKNKPFRLLVEGINGLHVVCNLANRLSLLETFEVEDIGSYQQILKVLPVLLKGTNNLQRLGIVVDADENLKGHWEAIRHILLDSQLYSSVPEELPKEGLVVYPDDPAYIIFGLWIMPDNNLNGMLEDFVTFMIPEKDDDVLLRKTDDVLKELEENHWNKYKSVHHAKARIHTWLSWQDEPGTPMGTAITKQTLSTDGELCQKFIAWLNNLFECIPLPH